ncbi:hypothetical protein BKA66DRAFT_541164 [Pyrenochaeta sp. MPI-SDFR-AT-0127]|nr:hypothetical protein BKA66DRAFT_541164 [Pyrenochaeta sp. MPI-SDFR-AT-0127]
MEVSDFAEFNHIWIQDQATSSHHDMYTQSESANDQLPHKWVGGTEALYAPSNHPVSSANFDAPLGSENTAPNAIDSSHAHNSPTWSQPPHHKTNYTWNYDFSLGEVMDPLAGQVDIPHETSAVDENTIFGSTNTSNVYQLDRSATVLLRSQASEYLSNVHTVLPSIVSSQDSTSPGASDRVSTVIATPTTPTGGATVLEDALAAIGIVLRNGKFKCNEVQCANKTFSRPAELKRHHNTAHAARKPEFWCAIPSCKRSAAIEGGTPFPREDKLRDHVQKVHDRGTS